MSEVGHTDSQHKKQDIYVSDRHREHKHDEGRHKRNTTEHGVRQKLREHKKRIFRGLRLQKIAASAVAREYARRIAVGIKYTEYEVKSKTLSEFDCEAREE